MKDRWPGRRGRPGPGRSLADHGARVPEVWPAAELEGFLTGLIIAMPREPVHGAAVGDDVEEAQEFAERRLFLMVGGLYYNERARETERQRRLLLSWAKAGKDSRGRNKATRSEGDDLGDSAARALTRHESPSGTERDVYY
jgi:hypothetical protein